MVTQPSTRAKPPMKKRRSSSALRRTPLPDPVDRPVGMQGVEETPADTTAPANNPVESILIDSPSPTTAQDGSSAAAAASAQSAPASDNAQSTAPNPDQSGNGQKASSAPKGQKRRLVMPAWRVGGSYYRADDYESVMRPPRKSTISTWCSRP